MGWVTLVATVEPTLSSVRDFEQTNMPVIEKTRRSNIPMAPDINISINIQLAQEMEEFEKLLEVKIKEQKSKLS